MRWGTCCLRRKTPNGMEQRKTKEELCNAEKSTIPANKMLKCFTGYTGLNLRWLAVYFMRKMGIKIWRWISVSLSSRLLNRSTLARLHVYLRSSDLSLSVSYHCNYYYQKKKRFRNPLFWGICIIFIHHMCCEKGKYPYSVKLYWVLDLKYLDDRWSNTSQRTVWCLVTYIPLCPLGGLPKSCRTIHLGQFKGSYRPSSS